MMTLFDGLVMRVLSENSIEPSGGSMIAVEEPPSRARQRTAPTAPGGASPGRAPFGVPIADQNPVAMEDAAICAGGQKRAPRRGPLRYGAHPAGSEDRCHCGSGDAMVEV